MMLAELFKQQINVFLKCFHLVQRREQTICEDLLYARLFVYYLT